MIARAEGPVKGRKKGRQTRALRDLIAQRLTELDRGLDGGPGYEGLRALLGGRR